MILLALMTGMMLSFSGYGQSAGLPGKGLPDETLLSETMKIFPNPSDGRFHLDLVYTGAEKISAAVYDITGKLVKDISGELQKGEALVSADVDLDSPGPGIYFLKIGIGKSTSTTKIIIR